MSCAVRVGDGLVTGIFQERLNRFAALVKVGGVLTRCHLPNPGRMEELLKEGATVLLRPAAPGGGRRTPYDLVAARLHGMDVSLDSQLPNRLVAEALKGHCLEELEPYTVFRAEWGYADSKFDFLLTDGCGGRCLLEVKSCTLVVEGMALFPDAPTERGRRHLQALMRAKAEGYRACVLFIVQRTDAKAFSPNDGTDPRFGEALRVAHSREVEVYARAAELKEGIIQLKGRLEVQL